MINLFESYRANERDLEGSLIKAGYSYQTVVLEDDGYLPDHILSPIGFFVGKSADKKKMPRFFNNLKIPYFWEIKADNQHAEIFDGYKKKGNINYSHRKGDYRVIESVEWLNDEGRVRSIHLYNQFGECFGKKTYSDGDLTLTTYFDSKGGEVILYHHVTKIIQLNYQGKQFIFSDYIDFVLFFIKEAKLDVRKMIYNSLNLPFFISNKLKAKYPKIEFAHFLFWQETSDELPSNMKYIIESEFTATKKIVVQNWKEFLKIKSQVNKGCKISIQYLGFIFEFKREAKLKESALILTHSDEIVHLEELSKQLPNIEFKIAAYTEMSSKLLNFSKQPNIRLYPNINETELEQLLKTSGLYLDINDGNEAGGILRKAFDYNLLEIGFFETIHDLRYINPSNIFSKSKYLSMVSLINNFTKNKKVYQEAIEGQQQFAGKSTIQDYKRILE